MSEHEGHFYSKALSASAGKHLVVNVFTSLDFGGVESQACLINQYQKRSSFEHVFVALGEGGYTADRIVENGGVVMLLNGSLRIPSVAQIFSLYCLFRRIKPTVVHARGSEANFHALIASWLARVPVRIGEEIGIPSHSARAKSVFRVVYGAANRVVAISDAVRRWLVDSGEVKASRVVKVYNPVEVPNVSRPTARGEGPFRIGFVGRLEAVKNAEGLIRAISLLNRRGLDVHAVLVGDGSQREWLRALVVELGINQNVTFAGFQAQPFESLRECDLYVQPSISEGFGLALVEAMGCRIPVVATAVGGAPEIVTEGVTGWLVNEVDPSSLADALAKVISLGPQHLSEVGARGRDSVLNRFHPYCYMQELDSLYLSFSQKAST